MMESASSDSTTPTPTGCAGVLLAQLAAAAAVYRASPMSPSDMLTYGTACWAAWDAYERCKAAPPPVLDP